MAVYIGGGIGCSSGSSRQQRCTYLVADDGHARVCHLLQPGHVKVCDADVADLALGLAVTQVLDRVHVARDRVIAPIELRQRGRQQRGANKATNGVAGV